MGILLHTNINIQPEGTLGVIKENNKFRQFLLRGNNKVTTEITLVIDVLENIVDTRRKTSASYSNYFFA